MSCTTANISVFHVSPLRLFHLRLPSDSEEGAVHSNERNSAFGENDSVRWKWDLWIAFKVENSKVFKSILSGFMSAKQIKD